MIRYFLFFIALIALAFSGLKVLSAEETDINIINNKNSNSQRSLISKEDKASKEIKKKKKKKKNKSEEKDYQEYNGSEAKGSRNAKGLLRKGAYFTFGSYYVKPSTINFMPVVDAEGSKMMTGANIKYTPGIGTDLGIGYRFTKYIGTDAHIFLIYPFYGSKLSVDREDVDSKKGGGTFLASKAFFKVFIPINKVDLFVGIGPGYSQLFKAVSATEEGIAFAGLSGHGILGAEYFLTNNFTVGFAAEYSYIRYSYLDIWQQRLNDAAKNNNVTLKQTMMSFGITGTYKFRLRF